MSALQFNSVRRSELFVGLADNSIYCYNVSTSQMIAKLPNYHQNSPSQISVHPSKSLFISTSSSEAILWDSEGWERRRVLQGNGQETIQQAEFSPDGHYMIASFDQGSILFWNIDSYEIVWRISLRLLPNLFKSDTNEFFNYMLHSLKLNRFSFFAMSASNDLFVYTGLGATIYIWNMIERRLIHEIEIPSFESEIIIQTAFLGPSNIIAVLSSGGNIVFINALEATLVLQLRGKQKVNSFALSPDGRCLSNIATNSRHLATLIRLDLVFDQKSPDESEIDVSAVKKSTLVTQPTTFFELIDSHTKFFNRSKLTAFLKHYGAYPDEYRPLIWRFLLKVPENRNDYEAFLDQGTHPAYKNFRQTFPLKSDRACKSVERILSCLAYWSPIFEDLEYLPSLVYPFVKLFWNDLFSCLEIIMTVLVNYGQKWWEYYPNPPVETLDIVNRLLNFHDPQLLRHFRACKISAQVYCWTIMKSAFSELFSKKDWLTVWDHLITNCPSFMYYFVVAYLITFRRQLLNTKETRDFDYFFQRRNPTNVSKLISRAYEIKRKSLSSIDPGTFLKPFEPLPSGGYPIFNQYPNFIINYQNRTKESIREEEKEYSQKRQLEVELRRLSEGVGNEKTKMKDLIDRWWSDLRDVQDENLRNKSTQEEPQKDMDPKSQILEARKLFYRPPN